MLTSPICPDRFCSSCPSDPPLPRRRLAQFATLAWPPRERWGIWHVFPWENETSNHCICVSLFFSDKDCDCLLFFDGKMRCDFSQNPIFPWVITPKMLGNGSSPHQPMIIAVLDMPWPISSEKPWVIPEPTSEPGRPRIFCRISTTFPTLPTITGVALLQHAVEVGAQVGHRGEAFIEAHDAATVLPVRDQSLPQLHEEIQPRKIAARINWIDNSNDYGLWYS